jgi:hypothetical protein
MMATCWNVERPELQTTRLETTTTSKVLERLAMTVFEVSTTSPTTTASVVVGGAGGVALDSMTMSTSMSMESASIVKWNSTTL